MPLACAWVLFAVSVAADPILDTVAEALEETLERPSDALDWTSDAFSFAASVVDEALRTPARRTAKRDCRSTTRDAAADIVTVWRRRVGDGLAMGRRSRRGWEVEAPALLRDFRILASGPSVGSADLGMAIVCSTIPSLFTHPLRTANNIVSGSAFFDL
jgi:hypothetical protein